MHDEHRIERNGEYWQQIDVSESDWHYTAPAMAWPVARTIEIEPVQEERVAA